MEEEMNDTNKAYKDAILEFFGIPLNTANEIDNFMTYELSTYGEEMVEEFKNTYGF